MNLLSHLLLQLSQTVLKRGSGKYRIHILLDGLGLRRQFDIKDLETPQDRSDTTIYQRELVAEKEALRPENLNA